MSATDAHCYAARLLNPFHGTAQIVSTEQARAISVDGISWRIQIRREIYKTPWSSLAIPVNNDRYFVYGTWSHLDGLARVPVHPSLYQEHVEQAVEDLLVQLIHACQQLPFALADTNELWLMAPDSGQAVALLASQLPQEELPRQNQIRWYPSQNAETAFQSMAFAEQQSKSTTKGQPQDLLGRVIKLRCKSPLEAYWIERYADGSGQPLQNHAGKSVAQRDMLPAGSFPVCLLDEDWHDPQAAQLVRDYLNWQAPLLLMLPLPDSKRRELEIQAQKRSLSVHQYHRLYPAVADESLLKKILVEAVMRNATENS
jgi:hypothetical protein